jgi:hypothetical protein
VLYGLTGAEPELRPKGMRRPGTRRGNCDRTKPGTPEKKKIVEYPDEGWKNTKRRTDAWTDRTREEGNNERSTKSDREAGDLSPQKRIAGMQNQTETDYPK